MHSAVPVFSSTVFVTFLLEGKLGRCQVHFQQECFLLLQAQSSSLTTSSKSRRVSILYCPSFVAAGFVRFCCTKYVASHELYFPLQAQSSSRSLKTAYDVCTRLRVAGVPRSRYAWWTTNSFSLAQRCFSRFSSNFCHIFQEHVTSHELYSQTESCFSACRLNHLPAVRKRCAMYA